MSQRPDAEGRDGPGEPLQGQLADGLGFDQMLGVAQDGSRGDGRIAKPGGSRNDSQIKYRSSTYRARRC